MRVAVSGSSGLIGTALAEALPRHGHEVVRLVRADPRPGEVCWDPAAGRVDPEALEGIDAVVHLAGAGIGDRRLTAARRDVVRRSRLDSTALLAGTVAALDHRPSVLVSASAVGYYGDRGDEVLTERSQGGRGFLADLCRQWEEAAAAVTRAGIRAVMLRSGIVLSRKGGALARQLPLFRAGLGGRLGSGRQWTSWVTLPDVVRAILHVVDRPSVEGPVNVTAPGPVTNREFTASLGRALRRPTRLAVPRAALVLAVGRPLVSELVLASQRALPAALLADGFRFEHENVDEAMAAVFGAGPAAGSGFAAGSGASLGS